MAMVPACSPGADMRHVTPKLGSHILCAATAAATFAVSTLSIANTSTDGATSDANANRLVVIDCLLPGQVRKLGGQLTYLSPRTPVKATASECEIRGGEYVAYDRANFATSLQVWMPKAQEGDP